jgi:hypothetical protein
VESAGKSTNKGLDHMGRPHSARESGLLVVPGQVEVAMSKKENSSTLFSNAHGDLGQREISMGHSRLAPEEGHRLMHAFLKIEKASVREALVKFVEVLSKHEAQ